jgi:hypothetical protein
MAAPIPVKEPRLETSLETRLDSLAHKVRRHQTTLSLLGIKLISTGLLLKVS